MNVNELPQYKCHKVVRAGRIHSCIGGVLSVQVGNAKAVVEFDVGREWVKKHQPERDGYFVVYEDGYQSYSPANVFEAGYRALPPLGSSSGSVSGASNTSYPLFVVREGDTLSAIAQRMLGSAGLFPLIQRLNEELIKDADHIEAGWVIKLPFTSSPAPTTGPVAGEVCYLYPCKGGEGLAFVEGALPHQVRVIEEYNQLYKRHIDLTKFFDTDLYRSLSVEERNRLKEQSLFMAEYQRVLLERIRAF